MWKTVRTRQEDRPDAEAFLNGEKTKDTKEGEILPKGYTTAS